MSFVVKHIVTESDEPKSQFNGERNEVVLVTDTERNVRLKPDLKHPCFKQVFTLLVDC